MTSRRRRSDDKDAPDPAADPMQLAAYDWTAAAARPEYQQFPPGFYQLCRKYARYRHWALNEAACLIWAFNPDRPRGILPGHELWDHAIADCEQQLKRSDLRVVLRAEEQCLRSVDAMQWALETYGRVPRRLAVAMGYEVERTGNWWVEVSEIRGRRNRRHRQIAKDELRAFAIECWDHDNSLTTKQVVERNDIPTSATFYKTETHKKWVRDLCPKDRDKRGGRPRKKPKSQ